MNMLARYARAFFPGLIIKHKNHLTNQNNKILALTTTFKMNGHI